MEPINHTEVLFAIAAISIVLAVIGCIGFFFSVYLWSIFHPEPESNSLTPNQDNDESDNPIRA